MVLCTSGEIAVSTSLGQREVVGKGHVVYLSQAKKFSLSGSGEAIVVVGS
jgi:mannose-6-phosphate isomerase class I